MKEFDISENILNRFKSIWPNTHYLLEKTQKLFKSSYYLSGMINFRILVYHFAGILGMEYNDKNSFDKALNFIKNKGYYALSKGGRNGNDVLKDLKGEVNEINHDWNFDFQEIDNKIKAKIYWSWIVHLSQFVINNYLV